MGDIISNFFLDKDHIACQRRSLTFDPFFNKSCFYISPIPNNFIRPRMNTIDQMSPSAAVVESRVASYF